MFLLVPAYPGCPGSKAVKRSLLLLLLLLLSGIDVEGILRTNGSSKLLDKLRSSFNVANAGDVWTADPVTVGGLLKVFLLELPDGLIPQHFTAQFVNAQESKFT